MLALLFCHYFIHNSGEGHLTIVMSQRIKEFLMTLKNPSLSGITRNPCLTQLNGRANHPISPPVLELMHWKSRKQNKGEFTVNFTSWYQSGFRLLFSINPVLKSNTSLPSSTINSTYGSTLSPAVVDKLYPLMILICTKLGKE